ncbi:hypothetical protein DEJ13_17185 [Curtobacterium sp. MCLR17_007]|uniref:hypothetical protein n=1 Tax=Curtobacterium sp. MCLR17_007 TaxID=2175648 RepID=UPI000DA9F281|nr:hypothetical protein [Curtobacterium sp. MCLR17_007]WIB60150.1 hypothetical protein DEJ13_17185 [Curtobacterium sp. MCLR17_007]
MSASSGRPTAVTVSFFLWLITVLLGLIGGVVALFSSSASTQVQAQNMGGIAVAGGIIGIVIALVQLFIVFRMRDGRNWARIVLLVLAILQVLFGVASFTILGTIGLIAVIIATVLMFLPASNGYFRRG